jgi:hypothetical protein
MLKHEAIDRFSEIQKNLEELIINFTIDDVLLFDELHLLSHFMYNLFFHITTKLLYETLL